MHISWPTIVEGDPKAPFSVATTVRCWKGHYSSPWIAPFTFDPYLIVLSVKQGGIKYHFWVFGMTRLGIEPRSHWPLVNTLTIRKRSITLPKPCYSGYWKGSLRLFLTTVGHLTYFLIYIMSKCSRLHKPIDT